MIELVSSDDFSFSIDYEKVEDSSFIKGLKETFDLTQKPIKLKNINSETLATILQYCRDKERWEMGIYVSEEYQGIQFEDAIYSSITLQALFKIIEGAHYLGIENLTLICAKAFANNLKHLSVEDLKNF